MKSVTQPGTKDRGRPWAEGIAEATRLHPLQETCIRAYRDRWAEMLGGALDETVEVLEELHYSGMRLLALTNWSAETFHLAEERFEFLAKFEGVLVSGRERLMKPEPEIFELLIQRYGLTPSRTVFIDDVQKNVSAAEAQGMRAIHFVNALQLRSDLKKIGLPIAAMEK